MFFVGTVRLHLENVKVLEEAYAFVKMFCNETVQCEIVILFKD